LKKDSLKDTQSVYELWLEDGNVGTVADFLASLRADVDDATLEPWVTIRDARLREEIKKITE